MSKAQKSSLKRSLDSSITEDDGEPLYIDDEGNEVYEVIQLTDEEAANMFSGDDRKVDFNGRDVRSQSVSDIKVRKVDGEARTAEFSLSSEIEVERYFGKEVLVHSRGAIDLDFFNSGRAPLLADHDHSRQIGVIESVKISKDRKLRARVRFSRSALGQEILDDVVDGIRSNVSVGYRVHEMERDEKDADLFRVTRWSPLEVSFVSVPADTSVGVGRSSPAIHTSTEATTPIRKENKMNTDNKGVVTETSTPDLDKIRSEAAKTARKAAIEDAAKVLERAEKHGCVDMARKALHEGKTVEEVNGLILDHKAVRSAPIESNDIGLTEKERKRFSILRLTRALSNPAVRAYREDAAFELEASEAAQSKRGYGGEGVTIPTDVLGRWRSDVMVRDLNTSDDSAIIDEDFRASEFIDVLRNQTSVMRAGARMLTGLEGNVAIPKKATASSGGWIATEGGTASESEPTFGQVTLSPKVIGAFTDITRLMQQQSSMDIEALVRDDLAQALALGIDLGGLEGSGASGQPTGVLNTGGINTVANFAAAVPTFAETVSLETALAEDNALIGNLAYITDAATYGGMKTTAKDAGSGIMVLENGEANGYMAYRSQQATAGNVYFGNWQDLLIGMWDGLDILVDPYTASNTGTVRIVALQTVDVAVRNAVSFALGNDGV